MRLGIVCPYSFDVPGGVQFHVRDLAEHLIGAGHEVSVLAPADDDTPLVLNAAAWTHYSYALLDACAQLTAPMVELHISDPKARPEEFRHHSVITAYAAKEIVGQGIDGYRQALEFLAGEVGR